MLPLKSPRDCLVYVHVPASELIVQHNGKVVRSCSIPPVVLRGQPSKLATETEPFSAYYVRLSGYGFVKGAERAIWQGFEKGYYL